LLNSISTILKRLLGYAESEAIVELEAMELCEGDQVVQDLGEHKV